jgi:hypothetical protein
VSEPSSQEIAPLDVDGVTAVAAGTLAFTLALIGCLIFRDSLAASGQPWWISVCATGAALGLAGLVFVLRRRRAYREAAQAD